MDIVTTPVLIAAAALTLFFLGMGALNAWGEKHRDENPFLKPRRSRTSSPDDAH